MLELTIRDGRCVFWAIIDRDLLGRWMRWPAIREPCRWVSGVLKRKVRVVTKPNRWIRPLLACVIAALLVFPVARAQEGRVGQVQITAVDQLKNQAFEALRAGDLKQTSTLLARAAEVSSDPLMTKMADWASQFEAQRHRFASERDRDYQKTVKQIQLLIDNKKEIYAMELAQKAYLLAPDKQAFRREGSIIRLLDAAKRLADEYEKSEQWLKSLRLYSELSAIEPENPDWKEHLKTSTRRVRLLALYIPDELRRIQDSDAKEREEVDALINPTTQPTTKPAEDPAERQQRIDWRESLKGVNAEMLFEAITNARSNYYRTVSYQKMLLGGLSSLRVVATTPALQKAFPGLADATQRQTFLAGIDQSIAGLQGNNGKENGNAVAEVIERINEINDSTVKLDERIIVSEFADGAFGALDPFSSVIWPSDWEEFQKTTRGEFSGVGIQIQADDAGNLKVVSPLEDSPAYRAGIKPESIISHINGKSARWISLNQAVKLITGEAGTTVTITVKAPDGSSRDYTLRRETIKVASVKGWVRKPGGGWDYMIDPDQKVAYLRLTNFTRTTKLDLDRALAELKQAGARAIIFDLRYNPGGLLNSATDVVDRFIKSGDIVATRPDRPDSPNPGTVTRAREDDEFELPMVVLVNQYSASASEIVSGALKDHNRALIVGERTFGKGSVQMLYPLGNRHNPDSVLKLTTSHYYLPSGKCIHREENSKEWGVEPDLVVEMTPEQMRAAIDARQQSDVLRDADSNRGADPEVKAGKADAGAAEAGKTRDPLSSDAQLAAALFVVRLELNGADLHLNGAGTRLVMHGEK